MSKHAHQPSVLHDVECKSPEELQELYGIEIGDDGIVWDPCEYKEFPSLQEWAYYMEEANAEADDGSDYMIKSSGGRRRDDDY